MSLCCVLLLCAVMCNIHYIHHKMVCAIYVVLLWAVPWALYVLLFCASVSCVKKGGMLLSCLTVLGGFNCFPVCTACSNPQTCSTECKDKLVTGMDWCCLSCLKHVDNLVSREEKQILWKIEGDGLMSKLMSEKGKQKLICGRRTEIDHCHKGTTELLRIKLI